MLRIIINERSLYMTCDCRCRYCECEVNSGRVVYTVTWYRPGGLHTALSVACFAVMLCGAYTRLLVDSSLIGAQAPLVLQAKLAEAIRLTWLAPALLASAPELYDI